MNLSGWTRDKSQHTNTIYSKLEFYIIMDNYFLYRNHNKHYSHGTNEKI